MFNRPPKDGVDDDYYLDKIPAFAECLGRRIGNGVVVERLVSWFDVILLHRPDLLRSLLLNPNLLPRLYRVEDGGRFLVCLVGWGGERLKERGGEIVKQGVVGCLAMMSGKEGFGPGLSARYVVPALVKIVGTPRLLSSLSPASPTPPPSPTVDATRMHAARALASIIPMLKEEVISVGIIDPIFANQIPRLQRELAKEGNKEREGLVNAMVESLYVLHCCLPWVSEGTVEWHYFRQPPIPCHQLLVLMTPLLEEGGHEVVAETASMLCSACWAKGEGKIVEEEVVGVVDGFCGWLWDTYASSLSASSQELSSFQITSRGQVPVAEYERMKEVIVEKVMEMKGMEIGKELYETVKGVVGGEGWGERLGGARSEGREECSDDRILHSSITNNTLLVALFIADAATRTCS